MSGYPTNRNANTYQESLGMFDMSTGHTLPKRHIFLIDPTGHHKMSDDFGFPMSQGRKLNKSSADHSVPLTLSRGPAGHAFSGPGLSMPMEESLPVELGHMLCTAPVIPKSVSPLSPGQHSLVAGSMLGTAGIFDDRKQLITSAPWL